MFREPLCLGQHHLSLIINTLDIFNLFFLINPLVTDQLYLGCMAKNSIFKKERIIEKISYERRAYESVDDRNHS